MNKKINIKKTINKKVIKNHKNIINKSKKKEIVKKVLFGTDGIRGIANIHPMTPEIALQVGKAIAYSIKNNPHPKIVIGKDTRLSGYMIETALTSGIVSMGVDVYLVGPLPTPAIALLTKSLNAHAGIVITASHNPAEDNGIKIFDHDGFKLPDHEEEKIENLILSEKTDIQEIKDIIGNKIGKAFRLEDAKGRYIEYAKSTIGDFNLSGLKIILDCANGAAYYVAPRVFSELGAEIITINDNPDGLNINKNCGAMYPENVKKIIKKEKADIAITLDGDADRLIVLDEKGSIIDGDVILGFCSIELKQKNILNSNTLVVTGYSNLGLDESLKKYGINVVRTENGDKYVIEEIKKNNYSLGGETSGHLIFAKYSTTGDGIISALQLLKTIKEKNIKASETKKFIKKYPQVIINIDIKEKKPFEKMINYQKKINEINKKIDKQGRTLIRYSGTQNVCRIMIEGRKKNIISKMAKEIAKEIIKEVGI
jgi:phosphoglucosamine mutase